MNWQIEGLVTQLNFDEATGTTTVESRTGRIADLANGTVFSPVGSFKGSISCDGLDDTVELAGIGSGILTIPNLTIEFFFSPETQTGQKTFSGRGQGAGEQATKVNQGPDPGEGATVLRFTGVTDNAVYDFTTIFPMQTGHFHALSVVHSPTTVKLFHDGILVETLTSQVANIQFDRGLTTIFCASGMRTTHWKGKLDEFRAIFGAPSDAELIARQNGSRFATQRVLTFP